MKEPSTDFDSAGIEGMIDVLCNCLVIFMLLAALVRIEASKTSETTLTDMNLSSISGLSGGQGDVARVTLSIRQGEDGPDLLLDDEPVPVHALEQKLEAYQGLVRIALRRDPQLSVGIEDQIIATCRRAGVEKVTLIVKSRGGSNE